MAWEVTEVARCPCENCSPADHPADLARRLSALSDHRAELLGRLREVDAERERLASVLGQPERPAMGRRRF